MIVTTAPFAAKNLRLVKQPVHIITISGYARVFVNRSTGVTGQYDWLTEDGIDDLTITVSDLDGAATLSDLVFHVQDKGGAITADFPTFTFEGKKVILRTGFNGMNQADFATLFVGLITDVSAENGNQDYAFTCTDIRQELKRVIYTVGDDGVTKIDSTHPRNLNGNPFDILIAIFQNELGLDNSAFDLVGVQDLRDNVYSGIQFVATLTSSPVADEFITNELMKPLGCYLWPNANGRICVKSFYPSINATPFLIAESSIIGIPLAEQAPLINQVITRFDYSVDGGDPKAEVVSQYSKSTTLYGLYSDPHIIESKLMRSSFQGFYLSGLTSYMIFLRYGMKSLMLGGNSIFTSLWTSAMLEPGDQVLVSHSILPDRKNGIIGTTNQLMEVLDRTYHFRSATVDLRLLDLSSIAGLVFAEIAPTGEPAFRIASSADKKTYMFMCADNDLYSDTTPGNLLG